jgi:hypothetical protein
MRYAIHLRRILFMKGFLTCQNDVMASIFRTCSLPWSEIFNIECKFNVDVNHSRYRIKHTMFNLYKIYAESP